MKTNWIRPIPYKDKATAPLWRWYGHFAWYFCRRFGGVRGILRSTCADLENIAVKLWTAVAETALLVVGLIGLFLVAVTAPVSFLLLGLWHRHLARTVGED